MQPIWNETKTCCVICNGEIYNFSDLLRAPASLQARGHVFQTGSDTEVILHGYEEWGVDCLKTLNGMFAFAVWDEPRKTLFLSRATAWREAAVLHRDTERLIFASEIKALPERSFSASTGQSQGLEKFSRVRPCRCPEHHL